MQNALNLLKEAFKEARTSKTPVKSIQLKWIKDGDKNVFLPEIKIEYKT